MSWNRIRILAALSLLAMSLMAIAPVPTQSVSENAAVQQTMTGDQFLNQSVQKNAAAGSKLIGHYWRVTTSAPFIVTAYFDVTQWAGDGRSGIVDCPLSLKSGGYDWAWTPSTPLFDTCYWV